MVMDISPTGWIARYEPDGAKPVLLDVVTWHGGEALVYAGRSDYLVPASKAGKLIKLEQVDEVQSAFPAAPGWRVRLWNDDKDDSSTWEVPIAAWIVTKRGRLLPISASSDPCLEPVSAHQRSEILPPE